MTEQQEREEVAARLWAHRVKRGCMNCTFEEWWATYIFDKYDHWDDAAVSE